MSFKSSIAGLLLAASIGSTACAQTGGALTEIPPNKDSDLRLFLAVGSLVDGADAMARMQEEADLVL